MKQKQRKYLLERLAGDHISVTAGKNIEQRLLLLPSTFPELGDLETLSSPCTASHLEFKSSLSFSILQAGPGDDFPPLFLRTPDSARLLIRIDRPFCTLMIPLESATMADALVRQMRNQVSCLPRLSYWPLWPSDYAMGRGSAWARRPALQSTPPAASLPIHCFVSKALWGGEIRAWDSAQGRSLFLSLIELNTLKFPFGTGLLTPASSEMRPWFHVLHISKVSEKPAESSFFFFF